MTASTIEALQERVAAGVGRVDKSAGVIRGVRILGRVSRNGREYTREAVSSAKRLYEGVHVNLNHPQRQSAGDDRNVVDRIGWLANVKESSDGGLMGDLHLIVNHPHAAAILEMAEKNPTLLGLSHDAEGRVVQRGGKAVVEEITRVRSVDLVADPATAHSLFESVLGGLPVDAAGFARCLLEGDGADAPADDSANGANGDQGNELAVLQNLVLQISDRAETAAGLVDALENLVLTQRSTQRQTIDRQTDDVAMPADAGDFAEMVTGGTRRPVADPRDDHDRFLETIRA